MTRACIASFRFFLLLLVPLDPLVRLGDGLEVKEAVDKEGGFGDNGGQLQGLDEVAVSNGNLVHDACAAQCLDKVAAVNGGLGHVYHRVQVLLDVGLVLGGPGLGREHDHGRQVHVEEQDRVGLD